MLESYVGSLGAVSFSLGRLDQIQQILERTLPEAHPNRGEYWLQRAETLGAEDLEDARQALDRALAILESTDGQANNKSPNDFAYFFNVAAVSSR